MWKEVGGTRTYFHYADEGLVGEYDATGTEIKTYGYKPGSTWTTDPLFMKVGTEYYFYHNDHLGTPQKMTAINGAVVWSAKYESFGKATIEVETVENNLRFPGQYFDEETGLHYNCFRFYNPVVGKYIRIDPIGFMGEDVNIYGYLWNDPINLIDPFGLFGDGRRRSRSPNNTSIPLGHSDFTGYNIFDYTKEDYGLTNPIFPGTPFHFRNPDKVRKDLEKALMKCDNGKFERYMHQGQDYFSHYAKGYRWWPFHGWHPKHWGPGHSLALTGPDKDMNAWRKAEKWTQSWVQIWKSFCKKCNGIWVRK